MEPEGEDIRVGEIVVSPRMRRLEAGGRELEVTSREFEVAAALASHPDWVHSADQLCSDDPETNSSPGAVNVHVSHLRHKLADCGFPGAIETVRGVGYTMRRDHCGASGTDAGSATRVLPLATEALHAPPDDGLAGIGPQLVMLRRALGLTQAQLGERVGVKRQQVQRWESCAYRSATLERVARVADALGWNQATARLRPVS